MHDVIIVGAGPSGLICACTIKEFNPLLKVAIIDKNNEIGKKLSLTGGTRCNLLVNISSEQFINHLPSDGRFLYTAFNQVSIQDLYDYFTNNGLALKTEDHHRVFPFSNKASDVNHFFKLLIKKYNIDILFNESLIDINIKNKTIKTTITTRSYKELVIATGGQSFKHTGSTGDGYKIAEKLGITVTPLLPAEVPLKTRKDVSYLKGLSFQDVLIEVYNDDKKKPEITIQHDILLTHFGLSGPGILQSSSHVQKLLSKNKKAIIAIDFLPNQTIESLSQLILKDKQKGNKKKIINYLDETIKLPHRLLSYILTERSINHEMTLQQLSDTNILDITNMIKHMPFEIQSTLGFETAFVTMGGVSLKSIDPKTMASKTVPNLYFVGEVLDLNGWTGGYNLTIAFLTGRVAGIQIAKKENRA